MAINRDEIIEEITAHMRKFGGTSAEWSVGTAKDARAPFFRRHFAEDLGDGLIYREAFTTTTADAVVEHLVEDCGLTAAVGAKRPGADLKVGATSAEGSSALQGIAPGKIVFVYRPVQNENAARGSQPARAVITG